MVIYNTTFHIENDIHLACVEYLKNKYIPQAVLSGHLQNPCLRKVLQNEENEGESYCVQFHVANIDTLNLWLKTDGIRIQQALVNTFGPKVAGFTTLLEEIDL